MKFNDVEMPSWFRIIDIYGRGIASRNLDLVTVPGMHGAHLNEVITPPKYLEIKVRIDAKDRLELSERIDEINAILDVQEPVPIVFSDEPNWTYYGIPEITSDEGRKTFFARDTITIVCPDPYKYGPEKTVIFPSDVVAYNYKGSAEAFPVYEMTVTAPITFAMIQNHLEESMLIGELAEAVNEIVDTRTLLLEERGQTLETWTSSGTSVDGTVSGNLGTDNDGITVPSYGADVPNWHGPALMKEIEPAQDFEVEMMLEGEATGNMTYRIEFYLFDENMNVLGKMAIKDQALGMSKKDAEGRIGPFLGRGENYLISSQNYSYRWPFFFGMLRMRRIGKQFEFYVTRVANNTNHVYSLKETFNDINNEYAGRLKFVQIHIGKHGDTQRANAPKIHHIKVTELSQATVDQTPYIAYPGDVITFDTQTEEMLINGEDVMTEKAFISDFFTLKKGENTLAILPEDSLEVEMRYRERRK